MNRLPLDLLMSKNYFQISMMYGSDDFQLFKQVWNQGIDSYLEGFTESQFRLEPQPPTGSRGYFYIHYSEMQILLRRLTELETYEADQWAGDIVESYYEVSCYE